MQFTSVNKSVRSDIAQSTGAYYTAKLTFSHDFPIKVWGAYYTSVHIIFECLRYAIANKRPIDVNVRTNDIA